MVKRVEELKKEVAKLIAISATCSLPERLNLMNALERLCLDYLFETEIDVALVEIHNANVNDYDLHTVALWFYLLRKHGYKVSPGKIDHSPNNYFLLCNIWMTLLEQCTKSKMVQSK
jgi:hypothetical protein